MKPKRNPFKQNGWAVLLEDEDLTPVTYQLYKSKKGIEWYLKNYDENARVIPVTILERGTKFSKKTGRSKASRSEVCRWKLSESGIFFKTCKKSIYKACFDAVEMVLCPYCGNKIKEQRSGVERKRNIKVIVEQSSPVAFSKKKRVKRQKGAEHGR